MDSFLRPQFRDEARALLLLSRVDDAPVTGQPIRLGDGATSVRLTATRLTVDGGTATVLGFATERYLASDASTVTDRGEMFDVELARLERDLLASQDALQRSLAEVQAANEELEASSEELQAASEELQASNEELGTLNQESRQRGDQLLAVNTDLENVQASLSQGMVMVNSDLEVTRFTPLAVRVFALLDTDIGRPLMAIPMTTSIPGLEPALREVLAGSGRRTIESLGTSPAYLVQVLPYLAADGRRLGAIITLTDVSEMVALRATAEGVLHDLQEKSVLLEHEAAFDSVTNLLNRRFFVTALETEIIRAQRSRVPIALAWLDIDRFKEVNDEFGHEAGDLTLRSVAEQVLAGVRGTDVVGRLGGDEVGVLISGFASPEDLDTALERILDCVRTPIPLGDHEARVTGSIGVAIYPRDGGSAKDLLRAADAAMYDIKRRAGDGYAYYDAYMNLATVERRRLREEMDDAIGHGDFELHYQPIVEAASGAVWGVEALIRWRRDDSLVTAGEFIPFCEQSGQIRALGLLTLSLLRSDLVELAEHRRRGLRVSVNMSASQLEDRHLDAIIARVPSPAGLDGLVVEILESVFLPDHKQALAVLDRLTALGAETSVDDYGAGYSNVLLLETLSPAYLKLDRSFLSEHHSRDARAALVRSAVEIAHVIGARVVAEGIEDDDQQALVRESGADLMQGFGIARPMPMADLLLWLDRASAPVPS